MSENKLSAKALKELEAEMACRRQVEDAVAYNAVRRARRFAKYGVQG